jgi:hypothetical protein
MIEHPCGVVVIILPTITSVGIYNYAFYCPVVGE